MAQKNGAKAIMAPEKEPFIGRSANSIMAGSAGKKAAVEIIVADQEVIKFH